MSTRNELSIDRGLARWIALGVGVIALIVMIVALLAMQMEFGTVSYVALAVAVLGIAAFVLLDPDSLARAITGRTGQQAVITALMTIFFLAMIVAAYYILYRLVQDGKITPWDLTEGQKYQLSEATLDVLASLEEPVTVTGFYSENDRDSREEAELWLQQYKRHSNGLLDYSFVDPDRDPGEAARLSGEPGVLVFEQGDRTAQATFADESQLTGALARVLLGEPQKAYLITGHGERGFDDFAQTGYSQAVSLLERGNYTVEELNLLEAGSVPEDASVVIIPGPTAQFAGQEVAALSDYLAAGGSVLLLADPGTAGGTLGNGVLGVEFSPDGSLMATAGADGTARLWNVADGDEELILRGHTSDVVDLAFSPDGGRLVTAGRDGTVRVWDADSGEPIAILEGQTDFVQRVDYSPDGALIASAGQDQVVNVWDAETFAAMPYSPLATVVPLFTVQFSPDGSLLAAGGGQPQGATDGIVFLWDAATGEEVANRTLHTNIVFSLAFTPDGSAVHSVAVDGTLGTLDTATGEGSAETLYPAAGITAIDIAADGRIFLGVGDGTVHIRQPDASSTDDDIVLEGHTDVIWDLAVSPDGEEFLTGSRDGDVRLWNIADGDTRLRLTGHATGDPLLTYLQQEWGITVGDDLVVDQTTQAEFDAVTPVIYSYNADSEVTRPLWQSQTRTFFILARSVQVGAAPEGVEVKGLMFTAAEPGASWAETTDPFGTGTVSFDEADVPGPVTLAASAENTVTGGRVVVIGDADFAANDSVQRQTYGNGQLLTNAVNWLAGTETSFELPPSDLGMATWDNPLSTAGVVVVQIAATCLIPLAMMVLGAAVWFIRRRRR